MTPLPLPIALADELYRHGSTNTPNTVADELVRMHNEIEALRDALRLVMACAGEISKAPDSLLEMALNDGDEETRI